MFSTPETSVHELDKNREISPLDREEGYDAEGYYILNRYFVFVIVSLYKTALQKNGTLFIFE